MPEIEDEKQFVNAVHSLFQASDFLKCSHKRLNLATKRFEKVWQVWWSGALPPNLEVDLVLAFEDVHREIDEALLVGVEVKYFRLDSRGRVTPNFYEGLQQALAYTLFGFDGVSLWHVFHSSLSKKIVRSYSQAMKYMIDQFGLPVFYLATRLIPQEDEVHLECFAPGELFISLNLEYFLKWIKQYFAKEGVRNPMRENSQVRQRRNTLKALLQIPV